MITIKEIAQKAGVSRGTVDRVLNNRGSVSPETERKIRSIVKQLNYKPNMAGMALAAQKKRYLIGIILFSKQNPFFDAVMEGFEEKANALAVYGMSITVKRVAYNPQAQLSAIRACVKEGIQGLIIAPYNDDAIVNELHLLSISGIPVLTVNSDIEGTHRFAYVGSNFYQSGAAAGALMKMVTSGPIELAIVNGDPNILCHSQRFSGFVDKLSEERRFRMITQGDVYDDDQKSYELVKRMLSRHPSLNAFFFAAGGVYGGCRAILEMCPHRYKEMAVVTFDEVPSTLEMLGRGVISATICQAPAWQGAQALELMHTFLTDPGAEIEEYHYSDLNIKIAEII